MIPHQRQQFYRINRKGIDKMKLERSEKQTLLYLTIAAFFNGFVMSSFHIHDIIAKKALHAVDWQVTILVMLWPITNLLSIWWGKILEHSNSLSKYFVLTAFVGRLTLILMFFVKNYYQYLGIFIIVFSFNALISPAQNSIYQSNLRPQIRGKYFGLLASLVTLITVVFSYIAGKVMDINEDYYRYIFVLVGIFGCISSLWLSMIKLKKKAITEKAFLNLKHLMITPIKRSFEVLKKNKDFSEFQLSYFIYGTAFMLLMPAIPKFLVENLQMDYSQTFFAKGVISQIGILFLAPIAGKLFDRKNPVYFSAVTFAVLGLYPLMLLISYLFLSASYVNLLVYFAFFIYGVGMSGIVISWNISSIYFAGDEDASMFQSVHVTLTGMRGIFAPFLGLFIMKTVGIPAVFVTAVLLFYTASVLSYRHYHKMDKKKMPISGKKIRSYFKRYIP